MLIRTDSAAVGANRHVAAFLLTSFCACFLASQWATPSAASAADKLAANSISQAVLLIHGGCGVLTREEMKKSGLQPRFKADLEASLRAGYAAWKNPRSTSVDAVEAAIKVLEDSELFNAGKGAVFTRDGKNELDASIMDAKTGQAGAVASVTTIKNPITAARRVMETSGHVLMVGDGAERFAESAQCQIVPPHYFWTQFRWDQYQAVLKEERTRKGAEAKEGMAAATGGVRRSSTFNTVGTVGAVARDRAGNLAAGTSTGGLTFKRHGRVGDSPILGAGNYADRDACAVSSTGDGEFFLRAVAAYDICALVKYGKLSLAKASEEVIFNKIHKAGGDGAVIVLGKDGDAVMTYNTLGMYRGYVTADGRTHVFIYEEELK